MLALKRFRVTGFRSVDDSGWVETDSVTALIGTNESGKTNLLVPLWKLNPAKDGDIDPIADLPRAQYNRMREEEMDHVFILADFETDAELQTILSTETGIDAESFTRVQVGRRFNGEKTVAFPDAAPVRAIPRTRLLALLMDLAKALDAETPKKEASMKAAMHAALSSASVEAEQCRASDVDVRALRAAREKLDVVDLSKAGDTSTLAPRWRGVLATIDELIGEVSRPSPEENEAAIAAVLESLPVFVYYSNYGNLDSEIYLPYVIENKKRKGVGAKEEAKARTLKVLFEYVRLSPEEILELGARADGAAPGSHPTKEAIDEAAKRTKERDILLRSADTELTKSFRDWWKQGDYRFRFAADGDHFRIWVADDKRPEEIELESRSTGLQWFFSFFLVFLVERQDAHKGAVLLLDEPGLSLHPLSQRDLSAFFENLSKTNPIIFTTHSPFMVDADRLDRVRLVYVDPKGATAVTSDLRATSQQTAEGKSVYAVHAALGLSVSTTLFQGCASVIVEGTSDQLYLSGMKTVLIARKKIAPRRELLFVPAGGAKGVNSIAPIITGKDEAVPVVLLDDDEPGRLFAKQLVSGSLYAGARDRILNVREFVNLEHAEIEDLLPHAIVVDAASRLVRGQDDDFRDVATQGKPIVPQIEAYASKNGIDLQHGWKVDLARQVKQRLLKDVDAVDEQILRIWTSLFDRFSATDS